MEIKLSIRRVGAALLAFLAIGLIANVRGEGPKVGSFWEPDFPFLEATVDARNVSELALTNNLTVRGILLPLGSNTYACFDTDLLRLSYVWQGAGIQFASMAPISYASLGKKNDVGQTSLNRPLGEGISAVGFYPGVAGEQPLFKDPRTPGLDPGELGRGPIAASVGRWEGIYTVANQAVLHYTVAGTAVHEYLAASGGADMAGYARNIKIGAHSGMIHLALADYSGLAGNFDTNGAGGQVTFSVAGTNGGQFVIRVTAGARNENLVVDAGVVRLRFKPSQHEQDIRVELCRATAKLPEAKGVFVMPAFTKGRTARWPETVTTRGVLATNDTSAYVVDRLTLPEQNPWKRRIRPSSLCFYPDGRAAMVTFDGDVWEVSGVTEELQSLRWRRIASGLQEPQSIHYREGNLYVFSRNGIVCLRDLNGDGEIDYYENFANCFAQSAETRDFAMDSAVARDGGIYIAEGGQQEQFMGIHNASVLKVAADGKSAQVVARGLRGPYLGYNRDLDLLTASDQQGNWIPTSPILWLQPGHFYGFRPSTKVQPPEEPVTEPVCWIPYRVSQSTGGQVWATGGKMGPLDGQFIQLDYFHPRLLATYFDSTTHPVQGAVSELNVPLDFPILKGEMGPKDGWLYLAGFRIWGSSARDWAGVGRVRYTGKPANEPVYAKSLKDGLLVQFDRPLNAATATNFGNFNLQRWNYRRTSAYGSGHYKLDGTAGQEFVSVHGVLISRDQKSLFLYVPDMKPANEMELTYRLKRATGDDFDGHVYFTVHELEEGKLSAYGFPDVDWSHWTVASELLVQGNAEETISAEEGKHRYEVAGCVACHSSDGTTAGRAGPTFRGLFGKEVHFAIGEPEVAAEAYIKESILKPQAKIVEGYQKSEVLMPSYEGVLTDGQIESLILYIKSLGGKKAGGE